WFREPCGLPDFMGAALPEFTGRDMNEHVHVWTLLRARETRTQWRKAAVAASLVRQGGSRTDLGQQATPIQRVCQITQTDAGYFSKMARTHRVFSELLVTGTKPSVLVLVNDPTIPFKSFYIAANYSVLPVEDLIEARDNNWTANELERVIARRKEKPILD